MRTIIDLPNAQLDALDALCVREAISRAEAVRRAVSQYLDATKSDSGAAFGVWKARRLDGLAYERRLRDEWEAPATQPRKRS